MASNSCYTTGRVEEEEARGIEKDVRGQEGAADDRSGFVIMACMDMVICIMCGGFVTMRDGK